MTPPSFFQTLYQPNIDKTWKMYVHVKRHALDSLPTTDQDLAKWLEARWMGKGERLETLRQKLLQREPWTEGSPSSANKKAM